jgi:hypothetical protein
MNRTPYRSLFWPILLIGVGLVWFLSNLNVIPNFNPWSLLNLWPLILIALGLDLIVGRRSPLIGLIIGLATIAAAVVLVVTLPSLGPWGIGMNNEYVTDRYTEPVGAATSATIDIHASAQPVNIRALSDSANLFEGVITHNGAMDFQASGTTEKRIRLQHANSFNVWFFGFPSTNPTWDIALNPSVPLTLTYDGASGHNRLDLSGLQLAHMAANCGSGSTDLTLPVTTKPYSVDYQGGSGSLNLTLPANTDLNLNLETGSGGSNLHLPANAAVRLDVRDNGSGSLNISGSLTRLSGKSKDDVGVWETPGFASAAHKITIVIQGFGSGSFNLQ